MSRYCARTPGLGAVHALKPSGPASRIRKRPAVFAVGSLPQVVGYVVGPLAIARTDRRRGWRRGRLGAVNMLGVLPLAAGAAMVTWAVVSHYEAAPSDLKAAVIPDYLVRGGAYAVTRNPMYVGGAAMQAGWVILLGSARLAVVGLVYVVALDRLGVPFEERLLHKRFGASYDRYRERVPKWLGRR